MNNPSCLTSRFSHYISERLNEASRRRSLDPSPLSIFSFINETSTGQRGDLLEHDHNTVCSPYFMGSIGFSLYLQLDVGPGGMHGPGFEWTSQELCLSKLRY